MVVVDLSSCWRLFLSRTRIRSLPSLAVGASGRCGEGALLCAWPHIGWVASGGQSRALMQLLAAPSACADCRVEWAECSGVIVDGMLGPGLCVMPCQRVLSATHSVELRAV